MGEHTFDTREMQTVTESTVEIDEMRMARLEAIRDLDASGSFAYDGYTSVSSFLIHQCGMGGGDAKREVFLARSLGEMGYAVKAAEAGQLSVNQLEVLAYARSRHPEPFASDEATLANSVSGLTLSDTRRAVDYWVQAHDGPDDVSDPEPSRVHLSKTLGGRGRLDGDLDAESHGLLSEALESLISEMVRSTPRERLGSASQRRAEALTEMARRFLDLPETPTDHGNRPHVTVFVGWDTLTGIDRGGLCELSDATVIAPSLAQRLACDARVCRLLTGPRGEILDLGRSVRTVSPAQWRALRARDRHCQFPGCYRTYLWCDAHHIRAWYLGGPTNLDNLILLCRHHHTLVHEGGWRLTGTADHPLYTRPDGTHLPNGPP